MKLLCWSIDSMERCSFMVKARKQTTTHTVPYTYTEAARVSIRQHILLYVSMSSYIIMSTFHISLVSISPPEAYK